MTTTIYVDGPATVIPSDSAGGGYDTVAAGVAAAGTTQDTATETNAQFTEVTAGPSGAGIRFAVALMIAGNCCKVRNATTVPLRVWPPAGVAINSHAVNTSVAVPAHTTSQCEMLSATQIYTVP